jgi:hypothetical protein
MNRSPHNPRQPFPLSINADRAPAATMMTRYLKSVWVPGTPPPAFPPFPLPPKSGDALDIDDFDEIADIEPSIGGLLPDPAIGGSGTLDPKYFGGGYPIPSEYGDMSDLQGWTIADIDKLGNEIGGTMLANATRYATSAVRRSFDTKYSPNSPRKSGSLAHQRTTKSGGIKTNAGSSPKKGGWIDIADIGGEIGLFVARLLNAETRLALVAELFGVRPLQIVPTKNGRRLAYLPRKKGDQAVAFTLPSLGEYPSIGAIPLDVVVRRLAVRAAFGWINAERNQRKYRGEYSPESWGVNGIRKISARSEADHKHTPKRGDWKPDHATIVRMADLVDRMQPRYAKVWEGLSVGMSLQDIASTTQTPYKTIVDHAANLRRFVESVA